MTQLDPGFLTRPLAHRALHDVACGRPENSRAAIRAAMDAGYGIEIDVQMSADGAAMVFHDYDLSRLAEAGGAIRTRRSDELAQIALKGGDEGIPSLPEVLELVAGRVPLVIEIKDQDGNMGPDVGALERAVAGDIRGYEGPLALMSFNPHAVMALAVHAPDVPRGLVTCAYRKEDWGLLSDTRRTELRGIPDYGRTGACFISHQVDDLTAPRVQQLKAEGAHVICWTVRSAEVEAQARQNCENITFEGYLA